MNQTLIKMAQKASQDPSLMASLINRYGEKEDLRWEGIAQHLRIEPAQLARLALCRRPRQTKYAQDIAQIADHVGMQRAILKQFIQAAEPAQSWPNLSVSWSGFKRALDSLSGQRLWAVGVAAMVLLVMGAVAFAQPKRSGATLVVAEGQATVFQTQIALLSSRQKEEVASAGDVISVNAGDVITVDAESAAQIRLFDGSTVDLFENTTLEVSELIATEDTYRVDLKMLTGKTVNRVVRLLGVGDAFRVSTPSSTASVRGTVFTVQVLSLDTSYVACDEGIVHVETDGYEAEVVAGTEVTAVVGEELEVETQAAGPPEDKPDVPPGPPEEVPVGPPEDRPNGPPEEVPGHTPPEVPGNGNPPTGNGEPPGQTKSRRKIRPVIGVPPGPPTEVPGNGTPGIPGTPEKPDKPEKPEKPPKDNQGNGPPESVPGKPPADPPGEGQPPAGGGTPPGQDNNSSDDNNAGGNSDNNAGGNSGNNGGGNSGNSNAGGKKKD